MKVNLELEDAKKKNGAEELEFMTRERIKEFVAADLFIPVVQELYDKNIFTNWSGLEYDAHIRIPLDGLSKENFIIAKRNCEKKKNWRLQRPPYGREKDIIPNYSFEIYVNYEDGITEESEVIEKMLSEIRKLRYQDIQVAKSEYAKDSKIPRVDIEGLYKRSEISVFDIEKQQEEMMPADSFEELSEMYLDGENPEYFYDEESDTYFRNKELIAKSKEYREYAKSTEKRKEKAIQEIGQRINPKMTDEEKYRIIFDWCINNFDYAYSGLSYAYAEEETRKESQDSLSKYYRKYCLNNKLPNNLLSLETREKYLEYSKNNPEIPKESIIRTKKIIKLLEENEKYKTKENGFISGNTDSTWTSQYGVCMNFAEIYKFLCEKFSLPCAYIEGSIDSGEYNVGHAWNAIMVHDKLKYVDISSAIHCVDGHDIGHNSQDFFGKTFEELQEIDGGKNRRIRDDYKEKITQLINESSGWDFGDN